jgi:hypothetical protein
MKRPLSLIVALTAIILASLACNLPGAQPASPTLDLGYVVAQTQTAIAVAQLLSPTAQQTTPVAAATTPASPPTTTQPTATVQQPTSTQQPNCTDLAKFVNETIPDNTAYGPGAQFIKTWTLQNVGTCTWTPDYALVFVRGEQMGGTSPSPIGQSVAPNGTIQIYLPQTAPAASGEHQGWWALRNLRGQNFALGADGSKPFWVKIITQPGLLPTAGLPTPGEGGFGPPTWVYTFDDKRTPFDMGADSDISFDLKNGDLVLTAFKPAGDLWRVANLGNVRDFAMEAPFHTISACGDKDGYGLIVRAPSQANNIIDSGYVFAFSCSGKYRIYRMDNGVFNAIVHWTANSAIQPGANQDNLMTIQARGDIFQLYANNALIYQFSDSTYSTGLFGLVIGSGGTPDFQVALRQLTYWDLH